MDELCSSVPEAQASQESDNYSTSSTAELSPGDVSADHERCIRDSEDYYSATDNTRSRGGGTSMKTIVPDDSLTDNTSGYHSDASNSQGTIGTKRESSFYQPAAKRKQRQRKREQDKLAALKYRSRKKQEVLALDEQQAKLELENATLVKQVKLAEKEIVMLKSLLREIYAPCNHGNPTSTMPQSSTSMINTATSVTHSNTAVNDSNVTDYLSQCSIGSAVHPLCHQLKERLDTSTNGEDWSHSKTLQAGWNNVVQPNVFAVIWNHVFTLYNKKHV